MREVCGKPPSMPLLSEVTPSQYASEAETLIEASGFSESCDVTGRSVSMSKAIVVRMRWNAMRTSEGRFTRRDKENVPVT
jgi:hypothetical protein